MPNPTTSPLYMKPMLAFKWQDHRKKLSFPLFVQPKLNGVRMLYQAGVCVSRDGHKWKSTMLQGIREALEYLPPNIMLDGELYVHGWSLQKINRAIAVTRNEPTDLTAGVQYHVYDAVEFGTTPQRLMAPFWERHSILRNALARVAHNLKSPIRLVETHSVSSDLMADGHYAQWKAQGYEGMMYRTDEHYGFPTMCGNKENRWTRLLKRKDWLDEEFEVIGVEPGEGRLRDTVGALVCLCDAGQFRVGTGLDDSERAAFWHNPPIGQFVTVKYEMLSDNGTPLKPSYEGLRA